MPSRSWFSPLLVGIQFVAFGVLAVTSLEMPRRVEVVVLFIVGVALGLWAIATMGLRRVSVMPEVQPSMPLVTGGPYRWMRHPMYTSLLLVSGSFVLNSPVLWKIGLWFLLVINQILKLLYEENLLKETFPAYTSYIAETKRLIPWVW